MSEGFVILGLLYIVGIEFLNLRTINIANDKVDI